MEGGRKLAKLELVAGSQSVEVLADLAGSERVVKSQLSGSAGEGEGAASSMIVRSLCQMFLVRRSIVRSTETCARFPCAAAMRSTLKVLVLPGNDQ